MLATCLICAAGVQDDAAQQQGSGVVDSQGPHPRGCNQVVVQLRGVRTQV